MSSQLRSGRRSRSSEHPGGLGTVGWHSLCLLQELEVRWRVSTLHPGGCKQVKPSLPVCMHSFQPESTTGRKAGSASTEASQAERMGSTA